MSNAFLGNRSAPHDDLRPQRVSRAITFSGPKKTLGALAVLLSLLSGTVGSAQEVGVPASLQAELLAKLEAYDRKFAVRAGTTARVLILVEPGNAKSELSANEMLSALKRLTSIGGLPHQEAIIPYTSAATLAQRCTAERVSIVYVAPGLDGEISAIGAALSNLSILTVGALTSYVRQGIVLGFELESGRPKIVINLEQARRQSVDFSSNVLRLMRVYR